MTSNDPVIFAGPSLPDISAGSERLPGRYLGPAAQGDLLRAAQDGPSAIVLIDGYFERVPAVHHKEILWTLDAGIPVFGAASLGALRAAELSRYGMVGVGTVFEDFATGKIVRDDEVALVHGPAESGFCSLSVPLVDIRATLKAAVSEGFLAVDLCDLLLEHCSGLYYPDRSYESVLSFLGGIDPDAASGLRGWLVTGRVDLKRIDALACLERVRGFLSDSVPSDFSGFSFSHTDAFDVLLSEVSGRSGSGGEECAAEELLAEVEALALRLDRLAHGPVPSQLLAEQVVAFREHHGLDTPDLLSSWLRDRGIDIDTLSKALEDEARILRGRRIVNEFGRDRLFLWGITR